MTALSHPFTYKLISPVQNSVYQYFSAEEKQEQIKKATEFLQNEMGQNVNRASRDKIPINLSKEEIQLYIKRFQIIDKDRKGYVSINDIRRSLKVRIKKNMYIVRFYF